MIEWMVLLLCVGVLLSAILAVTLERPVSAVITAGLTSLFAAVTYLFLAAPDVAMTEASIGSGLATVIFLYAINRTRQQESDTDD